MKAVALGVPRSNFTEVTPLFEKHAGLPAIEAAIASVTAKRDRLNRQLAKLDVLLAHRLTQIELGLWPGKPGPS